MYSLKSGMGMDNIDFNAMRNQGYYDNSAKYASAEQNYLNANMSLNPSFGFGDTLGNNSLENMLPRNDQNTNYYQEYCRLFIANVVLTTQMKELIAEKNELLSRLSELEKKGDRMRKGSDSPDLNSDKKMRIRRKAVEIERHYKCPSTTCQKNYGSEGSLIQHIKLKHPDLTDDPDWKMKILKLENPDEHD
jgi:hypothetical protein